MAKTWLHVFTRIHEVPVVRRIYIALFLMFVYILLIYWSETAAFVKHPALEESGGIAVSLLIGVLLVLRTNTAYDRWWEGRKLWGQLVNDTRNLAIKSRAFMSLDSEELSFLKDNLVGFCYALKDHLREGSSLGDLEGFEMMLLDCDLRAFRNRR